MGLFRLVNEEVDDQGHLRSEAVESISPAKERLMSPSGCVSWRTPCRRDRGHDEKPPERFVGRQ